MYRVSPSCPGRANKWTIIPVARRVPSIIAANSPSPSGSQPASSFALKHGTSRLPSPTSLSNWLAATFQAREAFETTLNLFYPPANPSSLTHHIASLLASPCCSSPWLPYTSLCPSPRSTAPKKTSRKMAKTSDLRTASECSCLLPEASHTGTNYTCGLTKTTCPMLINL